MSQGIKLIVYMHGCPKRQPFDSNILMGLDSNILMGLLRHTFKSTHKVLSKWGVCIIYLKN